ncbi:MAG TPA: hypothetical protein DCO86_03605, partial [Spirochaetaceae bacterium]|nr:hypothetical protein [Spirochaetaceae bacterium]
ESEKFRNHDLHIHVPAGAVPKDGPSAGITIMTAIASLITGRMVDTRIAMTGEVALRGAVLPIGGLPEKLMAAQRAGVTKVLIPDENVFDLKDVPHEVRDKIEVVPVKEALDVLKLTGLVYAGKGKGTSFVFQSSKQPRWRLRNLRMLQNSIFRLVLLDRFLKNAKVVKYNRLFWTDILGCL